MRIGEAQARRKVIVIAVVETAELALRGDSRSLKLRQIGLVRGGREISGVEIRTPGARTACGIVQDGVQFVAQAVGEGQIRAYFEFVLGEEIVAAWCDSCGLSCQQIEEKSLAGLRRSPRSGFGILAGCWSR